MALAQWMATGTPNIELDAAMPELLPSVDPKMEDQAPANAGKGSHSLSGSRFRPPDGSSARH